jgi:acetolactate synthase-1/2/3 large subunit
MGLSFVGTHQAFKIKSGQKLYTNSGHAPMGWGLPAALGACFANKKKKIICLTGEGGLQMNIQELATVMHNKLPLKIFIYNNGGYLTIKQTQQLGFKNRIMGSNSKSGLSFPNYKKLSDSHGIKYLKIKNSLNLKKNINKVLRNKGPVICELILDHNQEQMPKAINKRLPNGKIVPSKYEDMYPFLNINEIKKNMLYK